MDKIITADTSTYHISETFMIPTVVFFTREDFEKRIKYYSYIKSIFVKDESKNLSKFIFTNENLTFYKLDGWKKLKVNKIIKLLESF
jgi:ADP-heptose:LPS heptosyltransferase